MSVAAMQTATNDLSEFVQQSCRELGLQGKPPSASLELSPTKEEKIKIEKASFASDLQFSVPVNLALSKKAFKCILSGLSPEVASFEEVLQQKEHICSEDYCPMGAEKMDLSFLLDQNTGWK